MEIAIQGHLTRGEEIGRIFESLGIKNTVIYSFEHNSLWYYPNSENFITCSDIVPSGYKQYTLEEFEKKFPFKVGDKITNGCEEYLIIDMDLSACELDYKVRTSLGSVFWVRTCDLKAHQYKQVKEMKEKRNITLTLDKAKEWYKKGGELREVALQAFTEKELTKVKLPKTWEEFCTKFPMKDGECYVGACGTIVAVLESNEGRDIEMDINVCPSEKSAESHRPMIQLEQLRDCWRQGWEPIWDCSQKWCIRSWGNDCSIGVTTQISRFLTFPTKEIAEEFLECFRDLIEKAGDLI